MKCITYTDKWWCIYFWLYFLVSLLPSSDVAHLEGYSENDKFNTGQSFVNDNVHWFYVLINILHLKKKEILILGLTWYSLLNPAHSLEDMFAIWALMFLTDMCLFIGGPFFVFSRDIRAYSTVSFVWSCWNASPE